MPDFEEKSLYEVAKLAEDVIQEIVDEENNVENTKQSIRPVRNSIPLSNKAPELPKSIANS